ncbi:hypothetical protein Cgig2_024992 [Carnegiea gigantea]|uniref:Uncharacterized protein n=1 Tax=Carnegiea gigantea TaxID=171969 RepID=A0A9Q1JKB5_9CARY|nr:hypothetical protein Cgig2_024992 [Carnegiea gigantea]
MATRSGRNYRGHSIDSWRDQLLLSVAECMDSMDEQFQCLSTQTPTGGQPDPHGNREENGENSIAQDGSTSVHEEDERQTLSRFRNGKNFNIKKAFNIEEAEQMSQRTTQQSIRVGFQTREYSSKRSGTAPAPQQLLLHVLQKLPMAYDLNPMQQSFKKMFLQVMMLYLMQ